VRPRSDKTEIRRLRRALRSAHDLIHGVLAATEPEQYALNQADTTIERALAPKRRRSPKEGK
jgi:hypothetical protein